jgi:hypothetical protein
VGIAVVVNFVFRRGGESDEQGIEIAKDCPVLVITYPVKRMINRSKYP